MNLPTPYGKSSLNNGPLLADGTDFPCKLRSGVYDSEGASNIYALGRTYPLSFIGQAVHGGGSCQVSITYDSQPTRNSIWKVIRSIEGGCPAQGQSGNIGDNANAANPFQYDFTIPSNIPTGSGTIAWTWFNKIGNREMYMNCGPMTLTGISGTWEGFEMLPDMFRANINNGCAVPDGKDLVFPDPGRDVTRMNQGTTAFAGPTGSCPYPTSRSPVKAYITTSTSSLNFASPASGITSAVSQISNDRVGNLCTVEGLWNCISGNSFQRCAGGRWSYPQQLAAGMSCKPGEHKTLSWNGMNTQNSE